jgi:F-type H+-transporting ATPase subunit b
MFTETFWVAVALFAFIAILVKFGVPSMILGALDKRGLQVQAELDEAKRLRLDAENLLASFTARKVAAEKEAADIIINAEIEAKNMAKDAKVKMDDFIARRTKQAELKITQAEQQALADVRASAANYAIKASSMLIASNKLGDGLIDQGIAQIKKNFN